MHLHVELLLSDNFVYYCCLLLSGHNGLPFVAFFLLILLIIFACELHIESFSSPKEIFIPGASTKGL